MSFANLTEENYQKLKKELNQQMRMVQEFRVTNETLDKQVKTLQKEIADLKSEVKKLTTQLKGCRDLNESENFCPPGRD